LRKRLVAVHVQEQTTHTRHPHIQILPHYTHTGSTTADAVNEYTQVNVRGAVHRHTHTRALAPEPIEGEQAAAGEEAVHEAPAVGEHTLGAEGEQEEVHHKGGIFANALFLNQRLVGYMMTFIIIAQLVLDVFLRKVEENVGTAARVLLAEVYMVSEKKTAACGRRSVFDHKDRRSA
jgi:hypothetical protein